MRARALPCVFVLLLCSAAEAQMTWQPTQPPLVTADNETWYRTGAAIEWNGDVFLPAGAPQAFNRYQMVRSGSYRGVPLYTDTTLEPNSIVFVPIAGGRMQPYERPRTGLLAGSAGSRMSAFPTMPSTENPAAIGLRPDGFVAQAPGPPMLAPAYELGSETEPAPAVARTAAPRAIATTGTSVPAAAPTSGRAPAVTTRASTAARAKTLNGAWVDFNGRRWVSAGRAVDLVGDFISIGSYRGSPVYQRIGDGDNIYIPTTGTLVAPFKPQSR